MALRSITPYDATGQTAGSIASEARTISLVESALVHPTHTSGFVEKGDPVYCNGIHGVACADAAAATDMIAVDLVNAYCLAVIASDGSGTSAVSVGDKIYIATATGVLSKIATGAVFGYALTALDASATAANCIVAQLPQLTTVSASGAPAGEYFYVSYQFAAADVAKQFFVAPAACSVVSAKLRYGTAAGQAGTLNIEKCSDGEAAAAGDDCLGTGFNLYTTADTDQTQAATSDGKEDLVAGDALRLDLTSGAATSLADAIITVTLVWV
jgi:hypothetical protein